MLNLALCRVYYLREVSDEIWGGFCIQAISFSLIVASHLHSQWHNSPAADAVEIIHHGKDPSLSDLSGSGRLLYFLANSFSF
jgi:hypothetical protein